MIRFLNSVHSQRGLPAMQEQALQAGQSSVYIIIFVIVIIFAVMLSGGGNSLFTGNEPSSVTDTPTPPGGAASPSPTASSSASWSITVTLDPGCKQGKSPYITGNAKVEGPVNGTVDLLLGTTSTGKQAFTAPNGTYPLNLSNDAGFNTSDWKITITSGGVVQKTYDGSKTGC